MTRVYNTLTREKEPLKKPWFRKLKLFVCGPTVYDYIHIGNARTYVAFDIIVRFLRSQGYRLTYLQNITDIDDRIIARAKENGSSWDEVARHYEAAYFDHMKALGVISVDTYARATNYIPQIVAQVRTLIRKGRAYKIDGDGYYFDIAKFADYGKLARRTVEQAEDGVSRIDASDKKRNKGDFALWKFSKEGEPSWDTPLGKGRPGWHIEDTAISEYFFGAQYDIHGGGADLMFPHHEAEIAQQESASGKKPFVKLWMHAGLLNVNGKKMSKSLGNFITTHDMLQKYSPDAFRLMVASAHYRSTINYTDELMAAAQKNVEEIRHLKGLLHFVAQHPGNGSQKWEGAGAYQEKFRGGMMDDFNTPEALASFFDFSRATQECLWEMTKREAEEALVFLVDALSIIGIHAFLPEIPLAAAQLAEKREQFRGSQQFEQSDALRQEIQALGYDIEDTPKGPFLWPINKTI